MVCYIVSNSLLGIDAKNTAKTQPLLRQKKEQNFGSSLREKPNNIAHYQNIQFLQ